MKVDNDVKDLYVVIRKFEKKNWLKMATTVDLAKEIVSEWCSPTKLVGYYSNSILQVIKKIHENRNVNDGCLDGDIVEEVLYDLVNILNRNNEN